MYEMTMYWSKEDERYLVEISELPGGMADGKTREEALANVERVISEWIEVAVSDGREIPEPQGRIMYA